MARNLFVLSLSLSFTALFLTIEWFTISAWIGLSILLSVCYNLYYTAQINNLKLTQALLDKMEHLNKQCTRMSTIMTETRDIIEKKKKIDSTKLRK